MIIIGHPWIESNSFFRVFTQKDIKASKSRNIVLLESLVESHALAKHCQDNKISYAVIVDTLENAIFANALGATYIVCEEDNALIIQPIAQEYLFDTRILVRIQDEKQISKIARAGIDGVIFPEAIC